MSQERWTVVEAHTAMWVQLVDRLERIAKIYPMMGGLLETGPLEIGMRPRLRGRYRLRVLIERDDDFDPKEGG